MNTRGPAMGAAAGLLLAAVLIAGVGLAGGGGALHVDLIKANGAAAQSNGLSTLSGQAGGTSVAPPTGVQTSQTISVSTGAAPISSLDRVTGQGGGSIGLLLLPIVLGAILGAAFYGTYARRVDAE